MDEHDIRYTDKHVDESWKEAASQEKESPGEKATPPSSDQRKPVADNQFLSFLTSLAYQVLIHFGEIENPITKKKSKDLTSAKEIIDLLSLLKEKTKGNLTPEEEKAFSAILSDLQLRFVSISNES